MKLKGDNALPQVNCGELSPIDRSIRVLRRDDVGIVPYRQAAILFVGAIIDRPAGNTAFLLKVPANLQPRTLTGKMSRYIPAGQNMP